MRVQAGEDDERQTHQRLTDPDPHASVAPDVHGRRPEELERPWEPNQAQQADIREAHALQTQVDGDGIHDQAERKAFGEVQRGDPDELLTCAHDRSVSLCRNDGKAGLCLIACLGKIVKRAWVVLIRRRAMVYSVYSR